MERREILKYIESKGFNKTLWNKAGKAMHKYGMIEEGDKIAVGISGGKDSLTLFNMLLRIKLIVDFEFEIQPVHVHYKAEKSISLLKVEKYLEKLGYKLLVETTNIERFVFEEKKAKNPCSWCARLRRGVLYRLMKENGLNKLALGHHLDDIIETFMMNFFYQGNMKAMRPYYHSEEHDVWVMRPMAFVEEKTIVKYAKRLDLPVLESECRFSPDDSKRKKMKDIVSDLETDNKQVRTVVLNALMDETI